MNQSKLNNNAKRLGIIAKQKLEFHNHYSARQLVSKTDFALKN